jgi:2'-hydroxyisoflavone reductase
MWLPLPDYAGFMMRDTSPAREAGLTARPVATTARDTRSWLRTSNGPVIGLTEDEENAVLAAWHAGRTS